jgi:membrane protein implicated in regulation of membrane protease activity
MRLRRPAPRVATEYPVRVFLVYVGASTVGLVLLVASLLMGHGDAHDADAGGHEAGEISVALQVLSLRFWIYFLAFGGATGVLLRWLAGVTEPTAAIAAACVGVIAAVATRFLVRKAAGSQASGMVRPADFVGRTAAVVVPFGKASTGKVRVRVREAEIDLLATTDDGEDIAANDEVLIVEVRDGSAVVTHSPTSRRGG